MNKELYVQLEKENQLNVAAAEDAALAAAKNVAPAATAGNDVSVHVRIRPMPSDQVNTGEAAAIPYKTNSKMHLHFPAEGRKKAKTWKGFSSVVSPDKKNDGTYAAAVEPLVGNVLKGETACVFAYGHTGSGKTHTIVGYNETDPGMYVLAARDICARLEAVRKELGVDVQLAVSFAEMYQGKIYDLLNNRAEMAVRESHGEVYVRGEVVKHDDGKVTVDILRTQYVQSAAEATDIVQRGLAARAVGNSNVHEQSSRSHALLDFEIVTPKILAARTAVDDATSSLIPVGKEYTDLYTEANNFYVRDPVTGAWKEDAERKKECEASLQRLEALTPIKEALEKSLQNRIEELQEAEQNLPHESVLGHLVFLDLAGAEFASNMGGAGTQRDAKARKEAQEINKSLLALKECVRHLALRSRQTDQAKKDKHHVPFRNSKLTMLLKRYLKANNSNAAMIATISPAAEHRVMTTNTLNYANLVAGSGV